MTNQLGNFIKGVFTGFDKHPIYITIMSFMILVFLFALIWNFGSLFTILFSDKQLIVMSAGDLKEVIKNESKIIGAQMELYEDELRSFQQRFTKLESLAVSCITGNARNTRDAKSEIIP